VGIFKAVIQCPAGSVGQVRPRRSLGDVGLGAGAGQAHRPPRGKRSAWNGNQQPTFISKKRSGLLFRFFFFALKGTYSLSCDRKLYFILFNCIKMVFVEKIVLIKIGGLWP